MASSAHDVHLGLVADRVSVHFRRARRMGVRPQPNARAARCRHHRAGVLPADFRRFPPAPGLIQETDIQLDPLAGWQRRAHIFQ